MKVKVTIKFNITENLKEWDLDDNGKRVTKKGIKRAIKEDFEDIEVLLKHLDKCEYTVKVE